MALARHSPLGGVGYNKKHDVPHREQSVPSPRSVWTSFRRRRVVLVVLALAALFLFVRNIPTDVVPVDQRYNRNYGSMAPGQILAHAGSRKAKAGSEPSRERQYEGQILFTNLAPSLRPHLLEQVDNNVLFALPSLSSATNLLPIACQMAQTNRSHVHVSLLGRHKVELKDILQTNGIRAADCPVSWHDATPDHPLESANTRIDASIQAGFAHCCTALRPEVVLTDDDVESGVSINVLLTPVAAARGIPLIVLPYDSSLTLRWITALDSSSLKELTEVEIEIVIQAYSESAGSLLRLLRSLENANYHGLFYPKITIELPAQTDPFVSDYLQKFRWPPGSSLANSRLTLRHCVAHKFARAAESSLRTVEMFYPRTISKSHVLLLDPDAEVSASYMHYLMLTLLEYKYGRSGQNLSPSIFGIALETLNKELEGSVSSSKQPLLDKEPFVLSQTPSKNAALVFGDRWVDLHSFLANRLTNDPDMIRITDATTLADKQPPQWLIESLDLMRTQGWYVLYPSTEVVGQATLVTIHQEFKPRPEDYTHTDSEKQQQDLPNFKSILDSAVLDANNLDALLANDNTAPLQTSLPLQSLLFYKTKSRPPGLPALSDIPLISTDGLRFSWAESRLAAARFADDFSLRKGGCKSLDARQKQGLGPINHLFCEAS